MKLLQNATLPLGWSHVDVSSLLRLTPAHGVSPQPGQAEMRGTQRPTLVYNIYSAGAGMVRALGQFLVADFDAVRTPDDTLPDHFSGHIGNVEVTVFANATSGSTTLFLQRGVSTDLVQRISNAFDKVLATGKHDKLITY